VLSPQGGGNLGIQRNRNDDLSWPHSGALCIRGERTASAGGTILRATIEGTAIVNPDCTGTLMLNFFDLLGNEAGTAEKYVVYVDSAREANMIITHVSHPVYGDLSAILTTNAKKLSPGHGNECGK
jgi:hypothetical protein